MPLLAASLCEIVASQISEDLTFPARTSALSRRAHLTQTQQSSLYGNCSSQLPHLIEKRPQWLSGPSPVLPAAESPPDTKPGQTVFYAQQFLFNYWHRLTKMHKAVEA